MSCSLRNSNDPDLEKLRLFVFQSLIDPFQIPVEFSDNISALNNRSILKGRKWVRSGERLLLNTRQSLFVSDVLLV